MYRASFYGLIVLILFDWGQARTPYDNEWTPLSADEVFSRSRIDKDAIEIIKPLFPDQKKETHKNEVENNQKTFTDNEEASDLHDLRSKAIKLVNPDLKLRFGEDNSFNPIKPETIKSVNELQSIDVEYNSLADCENSPKVVKDTHIENEKLSTDGTELKARKSKAIAENRKINNVIDKVFTNDNSLPFYKMDNSQKRFTKEDEQDENSKQYKVTEDSIETLQDDESVTKTSGYSYTPPQLNLNYPKQNNFTDNFLDILSRHNIKPEDELPNYILSRRTKIGSPLHAVMFLPIPLRVLPQFNNLKQLSVDPLLAVLMSNYGYYFPGSYGIHSRYRNLYGHLATNNIHNNKPFGSYKIFSDTDSSN